MTVGTVGFVGVRLTEAREALGLTKVALAELIDVSSMAISQYESGPQSPRQDVLDKIIDKLGYREHFSYAPPPPTMKSRSFGARIPAQQRSRVRERYSAFVGLRK